MKNVTPTAPKHELLIARDREFKKMNAIYRREMIAAQDAYDTARLDALDQHSGEKLEAALRKVSEDFFNHREEIKRRRSEECARIDIKYRNA